MRSTPTRVHAILDHRVERPRTACTRLRSCWYWPTPIDFGSIFTSSASGSCRRRAIETAPRRDTSDRRQLLRRVGRRRIDRGAGLGDHDLGAASDLRMQLRVSSAASLSVSREAVPLPIAISSTWCTRPGPREDRDAIRPSAAAARAGRSSPVSTHLAGRRRPRRPSRRCASPDRGRASARAAAGRGQQEVLQVGGEHPHRLVLGRLAQPQSSARRRSAAGQLHPPGPAHDVGCSQASPGRLLSKMPKTRRDLAARRGRDSLALRLLVQHRRRRPRNSSLRAAQQRQGAVRRHLGERFGERRNSRRTWRRLPALPSTTFEVRRAVVPDVLAQRADQVGILGEALHQDGARAVERRLRSQRRPSRPITNGSRRESRGDRRSDPSAAGRPAAQGPLRAAISRLGAALRLVGQVEVLEARLAVGRVDRGCQLASSFPWSRTRSRMTLRRALPARAG